MAKYLTYLLRLVFFLIVILVITRHTQIDLLKETIRNCSIAWLFPAFLFYACRYFILSLRWQLAAKAHGYQLPLKMTVRAQIEIAFLEVVFPLPDSEDGLKAIYMSGQKIPIPASVTIILYDRIIGISILLLLLPFTVLLLTQNVGPHYVQTRYSIILIGLVALPLVVYHRFIVAKILSVFQKYWKSKTSWIQAWRTELEKRISLWFVVSGLLLAFAHALFGATIGWLLIKAFHINVSFALLLVGIPLYYISAILPLSIQGLGLYETALVFILQQQAVDSSGAVAVGLLHFVFHIVIIALGGIVFFLNPASDFTEVVVSKPLGKILRHLSPFSKF